MFFAFKPTISTDRKVLDRCSQYIFDYHPITVISGLSSKDSDVLKKILGFSTPRSYYDFTEKIAIYAFDLHLSFFTLEVYRHVFLTHSVAEGRLDDFFLNDASQITIQ